MTELTRRQETLLGLIVREYVSTPTPVSSKSLVEHYGLKVSTATVRNDMAALEELGLIYAPHTSAGRVPTEAGYRYFVQKLLGESELSPTEQHMIRHQFHQATLDMEHWLRLAASVLAHTARSASLITSPMRENARLKHLELINTQGRLVLMILVLDGGDVRQQMLTLAEPVAQELLSAVGERITATCAGLDADTIRSRARFEETLDEEIMGLAAELLERTEHRHRIAYQDGLINILDPASIRDQNADPELGRALEAVNRQGARQTLHLLEEQNLLDEVLAQALAPDERGVQVVIGGEGRWDELSHISMIISRYGVQGRMMGTLGVLGPTRLHYGRAISAVRYVAGLMSSMMIEVYGEGDPFE